MDSYTTYNEFDSEPDEYLHIDAVATKDGTKYALVGLAFDASGNLNELDSYITDVFYDSVEDAVRDYESVKASR